MSDGQILNLILKKSLLSIANISINQSVRGDTWDVDGIDIGFYFYSEHAWVFIDEKRYIKQISSYL